MPKNLRLESTHDSGAMQGLIVPRYKHFSIASVTSNTYSHIKSGAPNGNFSWENLCSEDDLRSRIFGACVVTYLACLPLLGFSNIYKIFNGCWPYKKAPRIFGSLLLAEIFEKVSFYPYNFRISRLSARKSEQMKSFSGIKICLYLPFEY